MPFLYVYSPGDFVTPPPVEVNGSASIGSDFELELKPGAQPTLIEVSDNDTAFSEIDGNQTLAGSINLDGLALASGTSIHSAYNPINDSTGHEVVSLHFGGDGYEQGAVHGLISTKPMMPGESYAFNYARTSHGIANAYEDFLACFAAGTMIATPQGLRPVETLVPGDRVLTGDHGAQVLERVHQRVVPATGDFAPVVLPAGSVGNTSALVLSPQHRVLLTGPRGAAFRRR